MASSSLLFFFSAIFVIAATPVAQPEFLYHLCAYDKGNYTPNSTYESNLNRILFLLSSKTQIDNGFYNSSCGQNSNKVHVIGLCRGGVNPDICRDCLHNTTSLLTKTCPDQKEAIGWYDECMLGYSNRFTFGVMETSPGFTMWGVNSTSVNFTDPFPVFRTSLKRLGSQAPAGGSARKSAAKKATLPNFWGPKILAPEHLLYALVQCTPDLTEQDCDDCLRGASEGVPQISDGKEGRRIVRPSCAIRFEVYPFNNSTHDSSTASSVLPPLSSPPASSTVATSAEGRNDSNVKLRSLTILTLPLAFLVLSAITMMGFYRNETASGKKVQRKRQVWYRRLFTRSKYKQAFKMAPRRCGTPSSQVAQPTSSLTVAGHQSLIFKRSVVIERVVHLSDFNHLEYESHNIQSIFDQRGWVQFIESTGEVYVDLVHEFYAQIVTIDPNVEELTIQVRGVFFTLSANLIAQFIGVFRPEVPAYPIIGLPFDLNTEELYRELTGRNMIFPSTLINQRDLTTFFWMLDLIVACDVESRHHRTDISIERGFFLVILARQIPIDLPVLII